MGREQRRATRLIIACAALCLAPPAHADLPAPSATVTADTTLQGLKAPASSSPTLTASSAATTYVRFHVDGLPVPPQRATLRLFVTESGTQTKVTQTVATWDETTKKAPAAIGSVVATAAKATAGQYVSYDVTRVITGPGDYSFRIAGALDAVRLAARESLLPPQLELTPKTPAQELAYRLSTPSAATAARYQAADTAGGALDALKIVQDPLTGGYLGVWHAYENGRFVARVGTSADLLTWQRRADLDEHASQPALSLTPDGGAVVALEADDAFGNHLRVRRYPTLAALLAAQPDATLDIPRTLAPTAEGTPNIRSVDAGAQRVELGFHYYRNQDVDRQAAGVLTGLGTPTPTWSAQVDAARNALFEGLGVVGNLGDRDDLVFRGVPFSLQEGQLAKNDFGAWREFLLDGYTGAAAQLPITTAKGSVSFGNGTVTVLQAPSGRPALAVTYFIFGTKAAAGEPGELVFYSEFP